MPYRWDTETGEAPDFSGASLYEQGGAPLARLYLSAHNSLTPKGFVVFIGATAGLISLPLLAVLGSGVLWVLLPFLGGAVMAIWVALHRSWSDKAVTEELAIWSDRVELSHRPDRGPVQIWSANTYWVTAHLHARRGAHRQYITLTGSADGREVELGAFMTQEERRELFPILTDGLRTASATTP